MQKLLTAQEMADILCVQKSTIYQWTHQGFIPHVKLRNQVRFRLDSVMKWLEKKESRGRVKRKIKVRGLGV